MMAMIGDSIRAAIDLSGMSLYEISERSGVAYSIVNRFYNRQRDIQLSNAEKVAECLGLELRTTDGGNLDFDRATSVAKVKRAARRAAEAARAAVRGQGQTGEEKPRKKKAKKKPPEST